jgi:cystathionine gamma-synthase
MTQPSIPSAKSAQNGAAAADGAPAEITRLSLETLAVRGGEPSRHAYDAVATPIVCSATYGFGGSAEIADLFEGRVEREEYGRYGNPTVRVAEQKLAALEGAEDALLFPSGMSAVTTLLLSMLRPGDHVLMTSDCYRRTRQFIGTYLARFGVLHTAVEPGDYAALEAAFIPDKTRLIFSEAPTNPYLRVVDVARLAELRRRHSRAKLVIDATLGTPANFRPLELGADLVLHSCTKYLAGHNDLLAGSIAGSSALVSALRDARGVFGGMPDPHGAYLLIRGLKTFAVRLRAHNENGLAVARFLAEHPRVERVFYPGLDSHPDHAVAARQFGGGFGGMVSFFVRGDLAATARFIDACRLATIGPSMGGVETLIEQPAYMSFYELSSEQRAAIGIADNLVRLSVGLESARDLIADLDQALAASA